MAAFCRVSNWRFAWFGIVASLTRFQLPQRNLDDQSDNADGAYGQRGAKWCHHLQIMQLVIGNQREDCQTDRAGDKEPDDLAAMAGGAACRALT